MAGCRGTTAAALQSSARNRNLQNRYENLDRSGKFHPDVYPSCVCVEYHWCVQTYNDDLGTVTVCWGLRRVLSILGRGAEGSTTSPIWCAGCTSACRPRTYYYPMRVAWLLVCLARLDVGRPFALPHAPAAAPMSPALSSPLRRTCEARMALGGGGGFGGFVRQLIGGEEERADGRVGPHGGDAARRPQGR